MEPNIVTYRPQLMKLLLAISLCLVDLDLLQLNAKYVAKLWEKKCTSVWFATRSLTRPLSQLTCDEPVGRTLIN